MKSLRNLNRRPTHPGAVLREDILPSLKMTQTELAKLIGISRSSVSELVHEKRAMSPEMVVRISTLLQTSAESWMRMQEAVDLWKVRQDIDKLAAIKPLDQSRLDLAF